MRAVAFQDQTAGYGEHDEPVCEAVLLLWHLHFHIYEAFSGAATAEAFLVLLAHGGSGWRLGEWASCEGRRGLMVCAMEDYGTKGSFDYWDGDCRAGDKLCEHLTAQSIHSQWQILKRHLPYQKDDYLYYISTRGISMD